MAHVSFADGEGKMSFNQPVASLPDRGVTKSAKVRNFNENTVSEFVNFGCKQKDSTIECKSNENLKATTGAILLDLNTDWTYEFLTEGQIKITQVNVLTKSGAIEEVESRSTLLNNHQMPVSIEFNGSKDKSGNPVKVTLLYDYDSSGVLAKRIEKRVNNKLSSITTSTYF